MSRPDSAHSTYSDLARSGAQIERDVPLEHCTRLEDSVEQVMGASGRLGFSLDRLAGAAFVRVQGDLQLSVALPCQRCLNSVHRELTHGLDLVLAHTEAEAQALQGVLQGEQDDATVVVVAEQLDLVELLEDELLLMLPVRVCEDTDCGQLPAMSYSADEEGGKTAVDDNPFAPLKHLLRQE